MNLLPKITQKFLSLIMKTSMHYIIEESHLKDSRGFQMQLRISVLSSSLNLKTPMLTLIEDVVMILSGNLIAQ
jgi:hypothetical protein